MALNGSHVNESTTINVGLIDYVEDPNFSLFLTKAVSVLPAILLPFLIVPGLFCNILAFVILVRRKMTLQHEGFVYMGAILLVNVGSLAYDVIPFWISSFSQFHNILINSEASCGALIHLDHVVPAISGWLVAAMLLDVCLRRRLRGGRPASETGNKNEGCCADFPGNYCTLFGAGFATGSIFFQLGIGCLWLIPFTTYRNVYGGSLEYCEVDLPPAYAVWAFFIERSPILVLTPVLLISLGFSILGRKQDDDEVSLDPSADETALGPNAQDFTGAAIGVALASIVLKSPLLVLKSMLANAVNHHEVRAENVFYGLNTLSLISLVVIPIVCLATLSRMREAIKGVKNSRCFNR